MSRCFREPWPHRGLLVECLAPLVVPTPATLAVLVDLAYAAFFQGSALTPSNRFHDLSFAALGRPIR